MLMQTFQFESSQMAWVKVFVNICFEFFKKKKNDIVERNKCSIPKSNFNAKWEFHSMEYFIACEYFYLVRIIANSIDTSFDNAFIQFIKKINEKIGEK